MSIKKNPASASEPGFEFVYVEPVKRVFIDGFGGMSISAANTKIDLFQITGRENNKEMRLVEQTLIIPTAQLAEACRNILNHLETAEPQLRKAFRTAEQKTFDSIQSSKMLDRPAVKLGVSKARSVGQGAEDRDS